MSRGRKSEAEKNLPERNSVNRFCNTFVDVFVFPGCRLLDLDISLSPENAPSIEFLVDVRNGAEIEKEERTRVYSQTSFVGIDLEKGCFLIFRYILITCKNWINNVYFTHSTRHIIVKSMIEDWNTSIRSAHETIVGQGQLFNCLDTQMECYVIINNKVFVILFNYNNTFSFSRIYNIKKYIIYKKF